MPRHPTWRARGNAPSHKNALRVLCRAPLRSAVACSASLCCRLRRRARRFRDGRTGQIDAIRFRRAQGLVIDEHRPRSGGMGHRAGRAAGRGHRVWHAGECLLHPQGQHDPGDSVLRRDFSADIFLDVLNRLANPERELLLRLSALRPVSVAECVADQRTTLMTVADASGAPGFYRESNCGVLADVSLEGKPLNALKVWLARVYRALRTTAI